MPFLSLPNEIIDEIVGFSVPEEFESLSLTCRQLYNSSQRWHDQYSEMRMQYSEFNYGNNDDGDSANLGLLSAIELIVFIASNPFLPQCLEIVNFINDSTLLGDNSAHGSSSLPPIENGGSVVRLFATSQYLQKADLDWRQCYAVIENELKDKKYSQLAATFLLTLLPQVWLLILPRLWKPTDDSNRLLRAICDEAKRDQTSFYWPARSLYSLSSLTIRETPTSDDGMSWAAPLLVQPRLSWLSCPTYWNSKTIERRLFLTDECALALHKVRLTSRWIDPSDMIDFLRHTPYLETLKYEHRPHSSTGEVYDVGAIINAIGRQAGSHLIDLGVDYDDRDHNPTSPERFTMYDFKALKKFRCPVELVLCQVEAAITALESASHTSTTINESHGWSIHDLIPAQATHLALELTGAMDRDIRALGHLIDGIDELQTSQCPNLRVVPIFVCPRRQNRRCTAMVEQLVAAIMAKDITGIAYGFYVESNFSHVTSEIEELFHPIRLRFGRGADP